MTTEENRLLIRHKIADFINNLRGGERFLPQFTTPRINHGPVITQNFAGFCADIHDIVSPSSACNTTFIASRSSLTNASPSPPSVSAGRNLAGRQLAACSMSTVYHRPADPSGDDSYVRPLFADRCQAGFPSPATDYAEQELDLNSYCISRPAATFFLRASGESMNQAGVQNGDLLVVDRAEKPQHGDIVIAEIDGEFTVKRLLLRPRPALEPVSDSPEFRTLYPENICIFGVVTHVIHRTRELR